MENEINIEGQFATDYESAADKLAGLRGRVGFDLSKRPDFGSQAISIILLICGLVSILTTFGIVITLGNEALRFFATTEWTNTNKRTVETLSVDATILNLETVGTPLREGDLIRIGLYGTENIEVVRVIDSATVEVQRGVNGTQAVTVEPNTIFMGLDVSLVEFFTSTHWAPQAGNFGILPLATSTIITSFIAILVALPLGLGAAIYLSEYASARVRSILKPILEILAGVPTVVYGYFALTFMTPVLRGLLGTDTVQIYNMASAGLVMGIMIIPTISSMSEDAISAVPRSLRDAAYGLGSTRLETTFRVILPAALSGIVAAFILGISRAVGETMIVLIAAGAGPNFTFNPFENAETMAGHIARISTGDLSFDSIDYNSVFAVGLTLFIMTFVLNLVSDFFTRRFREVYS